MTGLTRRQALVMTGAGGLATAGGLYWAYRPGGYLTEEARKLRALENDPMGAETILSHTAIYTDKSELPGWFETKYPGVHLRRYFRGDDKEALMASFIDYAEKHGWTEESATTEIDFWGARHTRRPPDDYARLGIALIEEGDYEAEELEFLKDTVLVSLDYD